MVAMELYCSVWLISGGCRGLDGVSYSDEWLHRGESSPAEGGPVLIAKSRFDSRRSKGPGFAQMREWCRRNEGRLMRKGRAVGGPGTR